MKNYSIVLYTKEKLEKEYKEIFLLNEEFVFVDSFLAKNKDNEISFDYLITDNLKVLSDLGAMIDNGFALTNASYQTSIENVYAIGNAINLNKSIIDEIDIILEDIGY